MQTTKTKVTQGQFTFDGFGVNGSDLYKRRLATLTDAGKELNVGPLLAAAPELLEACKLLIHPKGITFMEAVEQAKAAIAKAEGK